ncbi:gamma-butyrobetaine hydroxylase-like domain-containing protein [Xanthobacter autotrophicus DSM 431]|uniref:gamma-butyrobetaine hydroxylase-like domain-containing protein n=1 Tax=Xanthobacter nonsaccharivorans TaxID=3119912 RepID=UPI00372758E5
MMTSAPTADPVDPVPQIEEIRLGKDRRSLDIAFSCGPAPAFRARLSAATLRAACRCAPCTAARAQGWFEADVSGITLADIAPFGAHGLNLTFSDGHARGVFPFAYLAALAATGAAGATGIPEVTL